MRTPLRSVVALSLAFVARFHLGWLASTENPDLGRLPYVVAGLIWVAVTVRALAARSMYDEDTLVPGGGEFSRALRSLPEGVAVVAFVAFLVRGEQLSRSWFLLGVVGSALLLPAETPRVPERALVAARAGVAPAPGRQGVGAGRSRRRRRAVPAPARRVRRGRVRWPPSTCCPEMPWTKAAGRS